MKNILRRNLLWALAITGLIAGLTGIEFWLQGSPAGVPLTITLLIFALVNVNIILLMALAILIFRNIAKLFFERRHRVVGAQLRTRLVVAFVGLASLPALLLFLVSLKLITTSVQGWFDVRVENALRLAADLAADAPRSTERAALAHAQRLAEEFARLELTGPGRREIRARYLRDRVRGLGLATVAFYGGPSEKDMSLRSPEYPGAATTLPRERLLDAWAGRSGLSTTSSADGDTVQAFWPIRSGPAQTVVGVVSAGLFVPENLRARLAAAAATSENYRLVRLYRRPIRLSYTLTLGTIALLITFFATWFAFYLSRVITTPIQQLAEGTRRVAGGDLDFEIATQAQDEIGLLVDSFNRMTRDLKSNKLELERALGELQRFTLELERRRNLIATILETISTGVIAIDPRGTVAACNKAAQHLLGLTQDISGREFSDILRAPALRPLRDVIDGASLDGGRRPDEGRFVVAAGGQLRTLLVTSVPLRDPRFTDLGRLVVVEDLTQLVKAQRVAAWREAARRIAHEIKNPLTPIQLSIERARKKLLDHSPDREAVFLDSAATVIAEVDTMKRLIDEFSRFARLPSLRPEPIDLNAVIENAIGLYNTGRHGVEFATHFNPEPLVIDGDAEQLRRVFINLIENALAALEGPGRIEITTEPGDEGQTARVLVSDTGRGLPAEDRDRLFLPYVSTKKEGGGLGLAIVSDIVAGHGGTVRANDNLPHGTVFVLEFPLHRESPPLAVEIMETRHAG